MSRQQAANALTVRYPVHFRRGSHGRKQMAVGEQQRAAAQGEAPGRVPRVSRLMALAIHFEGLIRQGRVLDYAEIARLGHVSRARVTQIMNLLSLAPDIQEQVLFLPPVEAGRDPLKEWQLRPIAAEPEWRVQRRMWDRLHGQRSRPRAPTNNSR